MCSRYIDTSTERRLYAESMGRCMNPACQKELFGEVGDIIEKAHIVPYCGTADNSYENLVVLCPNCHTDFDKNQAFTKEEVLSWKRIRGEEFESFFCKRFTSFHELKEEVVPLLEENKRLYEKYYLGDRKELWDVFEGKVLANNRKLKALFSTNLSLFQDYKMNGYSNAQIAREFMAHVDEFEITRTEAEKMRQVLFPPQINSIFGVEPVEENLLPLTEALEALIGRLDEEGKFKTVVLGIDDPYIQFDEGGKLETVFLKDLPRLRQLYNDYGCFRPVGVRLESLNFALKYMRSRGLEFRFSGENGLREIVVGEKTMIFVYEYCLSEAFLREFCPKEGSIVINLHNWNGESCISSSAYNLAKSMNVTLLTLDDFYRYVRETLR